MSPWTQYFDLKGQQPPHSLIRNVTLTNVKGSGKTLGQITGTPNTDLGTITLKNADIKVTDASIEKLKTLTAENVNVNGEAITLNGGK